jgi:hypothetical protein
MTMAFFLRSALLFVCRRLAMTSSRKRRSRGDDVKAGLTAMVEEALSNCCCSSKNGDATDYDGGDAEDDNENDDVTGSPHQSINSAGIMSRNQDQAPVDFRYVETKV